MRKLLFFGAAVLLGACTADYDADSIVLETDDPQVAYVTVPDTTRSVTATNIEQIAQRFPTGSVTRAEERTIDEVLTISADDGTPLYYIVNYADDRGYTIISATKDYMPVLAYGDRGRFDPDGAAQSGVSVWMAEQEAIITSMDELPDSVKMRFQAMWTPYCTHREALPRPQQTRLTDDENAKLTAVYNMTVASIHQWESEGWTVYRYDEFKQEYSQHMSFTQLDQLVHQYANYKPLYGGQEHVSFVLEKTHVEHSEVAPLTKTTWGQGLNYNYYIPGRGYVGCTAVASGQIMRYHEYPTSFDWANMYNDVPTLTTAQFLYELGTRIGIPYDDNKSGADIDQVLAAFKSYGYKQAVKRTHDADVARQQLTQGLPVYMRGTSTTLTETGELVGHAWVCDGYEWGRSHSEIRLMVLEDCPEVVTPSQYYEIQLMGYTNLRPSEWAHYNMNWGSYGNRNGYYWDNSLTNVDNPSMSMDYTVDRQDIINIYPTK